MDTQTRNMFLAPCDAGNFDRTVRTPVSLDEHPEAPAELSDGDVRFWGVREGSGNESTFEKMEAGDLVLFYQDGSYIGTGWVGSTIEDDDEWASEAVWGGAPSKLLYTIEEFQPVSVPKNAVHRIFGYSDRYYPQGLTRVADENYDRRPEVIKRAVKLYSERKG